MPGIAFRHKLTIVYNVILVVLVGWDALEKLALAALDQGNLEIADVRVSRVSTKPNPGISF